MAGKAPWRVIAEHLRTWKRDAYVPLRVALSAEEQRRHRVSTSSIIAGYVRKDQLEVRYQLHYCLYRCLQLEHRKHLTRFSSAAVRWGAHGAASARFLGAPGRDQRPSARGACVLVGR